MGVLLLVFGVSKLVKSECAVAMFLCGVGFTLVVAAILCSDRTLVRIGLGAIAVNVGAALVSLLNQS